MSVKKDLKHRIERYLMDQFTKKIGDPDSNYDELQSVYKKSYEILHNDLTVDQLWSLYLFVEQKTDFIILHSGDYVGITFSGMYAGIEKDGYTHS